MKKEFADELDGAFAARDARQEKVRQAEEDRKVKQREFLESFAKVRQGAIIPALEKVSTHLKQKGVNTRIEIGEDASAAVPGPFATLHMDFPDDERVGRSSPNYYVSHDAPHFTARADANRREVLFSEKTMRPGRGGHAGVVASVKLTDITEDSVTALVVKAVKEMI